MENNSKTINGWLCLTEADQMEDELYQFLKEKGWRISPELTTALFNAYIRLILDHFNTMIVQAYSELQQPKEIM